MSALTTKATVVFQILVRHAPQMPVVENNHMIDARPTVAWRVTFTEPAPDEVTVTQNSRCTGMEVNLVANNGDAYWFSDPQASVEWSMLQIETPSVLSPLKLV